MRSNVFLAVLIAVLSAAALSGCFFLGGVSSEPPDAYDEVAEFIAREDWDDLEPIHKTILRTLSEQRREHGFPLAAACWESDPEDPAAVEAFNSIISFGATDPISPLFQLTTRWTSTAYSAGTHGQGDPIIISVSFPPDGTHIPSGIGEPAGPNTFFADFIPRYGNATNVTNIVMQQIQEIGSFTGISHVFEPSDDGAAFSTTPGGGAVGVPGVRGDVRIGGKFIDGNGGLLGYNYFPQNGDMVIDSPDSGFDNTQRFLNTISHEHGHGTGLLHVCPRNHTKLMEPFYSSAFTGPQHDDIRAWQRHYGDVFESNDTPGTAAPLGVLGAGTVSFDALSIDDNDDVDYFEFTVAGSSEVSVTVRPVGFFYPTGAQTGSCNSGIAIDSREIHNLAIEVFDSDGTTVLSTAALQPIALPESIFALPLPGNGPFFIRVRTINATDDVQLYDMDVTITPVTQPAFTLSFPTGLPVHVPPDVSAMIDVQVTNGSGAPDPANARVFARINDGAFSSSVMIDQGNGLFTAVLPAAPCTSMIDYYFDIGVIGGGAVVTPFGAPQVFHSTESLSAFAVTVFSDTFETDTGWVVSNSSGLTEGAWERGIPVGEGLRGDPPSDFDGSGHCYITDNGFGDSDIDGGSTILTSPSFDLTAFPETRFSYAFWYDNDFGANPNQDTFEIEISRDGVTWITVESYNASTDNWEERSVSVTNFVQPSANVQMRFIASDLGPASVVEAGLDVFECLVCPAQSYLGPCAAGTMGVSTLLIDGSDGGADRRVEVNPANVFTLDVTNPPAGTNTPLYVILKLGVPAPGDVFPIHPTIGDLCFPPAPVTPGDPTLFVLANTFGPDPDALIPATNTPWNVALGPIPFILEITFQALQLNGTQLRTSNAVIAAIGF